VLPPQLCDAEDLRAARAHLVLINGTDGPGSNQDHQLCTDGFIIRAQLMIRADGIRPRNFAAPRQLRHDPGQALCQVKTCALRAPTSFSARINTIRTESEVLINGKDGPGVYSRSSIACG
jgi:hypothetical protein